MTSSLSSVAAIGLLAFGLVGGTTAPLQRPRASGRAHVNGTHLYYEVYGRGPALVFLHAGLADRRMWDDQINEFSNRFTVVRFDARGYGQSDPPTEAYAPVDDLSALLKSLEIARACVVGISMGGTLAIDFAAAHPEMTSALVTVAGSPGWQPYSDALVRRTLSYLARGADRGPAALVEGWLQDPMLAAARSQPAIAQRVRALLTENVAGIMGAKFMRPPDIPTPKLSDLKMPKLVMVGDRDDAEIVERSRAMSREMPRATLVVIRGAGHMVNVEKPQEFNRALADFLASLK